LNRLIADLTPLKNGGRDETELHPPKKSDNSFQKKLKEVKQLQLDCRVGSELHETYFILAMRTTRNIKYARRHEK
jgi:hypothetical protein